MPSPPAPAGMAISGWLRFASRARWTLSAGVCTLICLGAVSADTTQLAAAPGTTGGTIGDLAASIEAQTSTGDAVLGGIAAGDNIQDKGGYTGQLYDPVALQISAIPTTSVGEGESRQLVGTSLLDDATTSPADSPTWSVEDGPLVGVSTTGLASADLVYQNTSATARVEASGLTATIGLTVLDTDPDDFGSYAGDGIDDEWQVLFFGLDNPEAAPGSDPDGDEQDNRYEFLAEVDPTDRSSFLHIRIDRNPVDPDRLDITFDPIFGDRSYTLMVSPDPDAGNFSPASDTTTVTDGNQRTITDNSGAMERRFYEIRITRP